MGVLEGLLEQMAAVRAGQAEILKAISSRELAAEWYDLRECCALKGVAFNTIAKHRYLQPCNPQTTGRRIRWHRSDILAWLPMTDEQCRHQYDARRGKRRAA